LGRTDYVSIKRFRQAAILDLVVHGTVRSQGELARLLRAKGIHATQATLSRDIRDLGLVKHAGDGAYLRQGDVAPAVDAEGALHRAVAEYLRHVDRVQQFLVLRTDAGQAQALAVAIDRSGSREVVGTIAGDDTILVITRDARRAAALARRLDTWAKT
jgi:transcriptional regulator of arginine metabolism